LTSDLYTAYQDSHASLHLDGSEAAVNNVASSASRLYSKFARLLDVQGFLVSLLPLGAKIVDAVFGSLPGAIAETLASAAAQSASGNLVLYDCSSLWKLKLVPKVIASRNDLTNQGMAPIIRLSTHLDPP
jgi:hypothetical protein